MRMQRNMAEILWLRYEAVNALSGNSEGVTCKMNNPVSMIRKPHANTVVAETKLQGIGLHGRSMVSISWSNASLRNMPEIYKRVIVKSRIKILPSN